MAALAGLFVLVGGLSCTTDRGGSGQGASALEYEVVARHPHDPGAFTQGLFFHGGFLYEGTGRTYQSTLRKVEIDTGTVLQRVKLADRYFGEGIALVDDRIIQLTWRNREGFVYSLESLERIGKFRYRGEGWGLTYDGERLIMSDGTSYLRFLDPESFREVGSVRVYEGDRPVTDQLNELEYIRGKVWANSWNTDEILCIDLAVAPGRGTVTGRLDLAGLIDFEPTEEQVLNGVAWDPATDRIWVTGKLWPSLFEIRVPE